MKNKVKALADFLEVEQDQITFNSDHYFIYRVN